MKHVPELKTVKIKIPLTRFKALKEHWYESEKCKRICV